MLGKSSGVPLQRLISITMENFAIVSAAKAALESRLCILVPRDETARLPSTHGYHSQSSVVRTSVKNIRRID